MTRYRCAVCNYVYDEEKGVKFTELPEDWRCPVCNALKSVFVELKEKEKPELLENTVSDVLVEQMAEWGVEYVFGIPGTSSLGVVDAIRKNPKITYIQVRHELTAAFMASAYGKLTGNISACLTVAGPGASNLATGLYDAKLDHSPVLALTGQVERVSLGTDIAQEIDQQPFFEPICVFNKTMMSKEQSTILVTQAIKHALIEKGVSHIGIPNDVQKLPYKTDIIPLEGNLANQTSSPLETHIHKAVNIINDSKRPVIIAGFGSMGQGNNLIRLAEKITSPIVTTFRGKGVINEEHPFYMGSHGKIGSTSASEMVQKSDLLIVIGSSFSDLTQIPEKPTVQIDRDPLMIAKRYPVEVGLVGDASEIIPKLVNIVKKREDSKYKEEMKLIKQSWIDLLEKEAQKVACLVGDGGFSMVMGDFLTAVKYDLPIKVFLFNNKQLGMIMLEQKVENYVNWQTELQDCDYAGFAENCGGFGLRVDDPTELPLAVDKALKSKIPTLVDINTDPARFIKI